MKPIGTMLSEHFQRHKVVHKLDDDTFGRDFGDFYLFVQAKETTRKVLCRCVASFFGPEAGRETIAVFLNQLNDMLDGCSWSIDPNDGMITHKTFLWACDRDLSDVQIMNSVCLAIKGAHVMLPIIQAVGEEALSPSEAFEKVLDGRMNCGDQEIVEDDPEDKRGSDEGWDRATVPGSKLIQ